MCISLRSGIHISASKRRHLTVWLCNPLQLNGVIKEGLVIGVCRCTWDSLSRIVWRGCGEGVQCGENWGTAGQGGVD